MAKGSSTAGTTISTALKSEQKTRGINQRQAAEAIGVERSVYSRWIGTRGALPAMHNIAGVATFLHKTETEVLAMFPAGYQVRAARGGSMAMLDQLIADVHGLAAKVEALTEEVAELRRR